MWERCNRRCKNCDPCLREDCGKCGFCVDKPKFGGPGVQKQACVHKKCLTLMDGRSGNRHKPAKQTSIEDVSTISKLNPDSPLDIRELKEGRYDDREKLANNSAENILSTIRAVNIGKLKNEDVEHVSTEKLYSQPISKELKHISQPSPYRTDNLGVSVNPIKKRKVDKDVHMGSFDTSLDIQILETEGGDSVINIDKMFDTREGNYEVFVADEITLLDEIRLVDNVQNSPSLDEWADDTGENQVKDMNKMAVSFIDIFNTVGFEKKIALIDQVLGSCAEETQDKIVAHMIRSVKKRKFGKKVHKKQSQLEKTACKNVQSSKLSHPTQLVQPSQASRPGAHFSAAMDYAVSIVRPRPAMSLLVCDCSLYRTTNQGKLKKHIEAVHGGLIHHEWQTCGECEQNFKHWEDLKLHIGNAHCENTLKNKENYRNSKNCDEAILESKDFHSKSINNRANTNHSCSTCRRQFQSQADLCMHREEQEECRYTCQECPETFTTESNMMDHIFQHMGSL